MHQFPIFEAAKTAIGFSFKNINTFIQACYIWVVAYALFIGVFLFLGFGEFLELWFSQKFHSLDVLSINVRISFDQAADIANQNALYVMTKQLAQQHSLQLFWFQIINLMLVLVSLCAIAVSLHRKFLLNEQPSVFETGLKVLKYFGFSLLFAFAVTFVVVGVVLGSGLFSQFSIYPFVLAGSVLIILFFSLRFMPFLPAIATGDNRVSYGYSWRRTGGNNWRILAAALLVVIAVIIVSMAHKIIYIIGLPLIITMPLSLFIILFKFSFIINYMSVCYKFFIPPPETMASPKPESPQVI